MARDYDTSPMTNHTVGVLAYLIYRVYWLESLLNRVVTGMIVIGICVGVCVGFVLWIIYHAILGLVWGVQLGWSLVFRGPSHYFSRSAGKDGRGGECSPRAEGECHDSVAPAGSLCVARDAPSRGEGRGECEGNDDTPDRDIRPDGDESRRAERERARYE